MFKKILRFFSKFDLKLRLYRLVLSDKRTPKIVKVLLGFIVGYAIFPFDFVTDLFPILGWIDDLLVIFSLIWLIFRIIPKKIVEDSQKKIRESNKKG